MKKDLHSRLLRGLPYMQVKFPSGISNPRSDQEPITNLGPRDFSTRNPRAESNDREIKRKNELSFQKYVFPFKLKCFKAKRELAYRDWPVLSHDILFIVALIPR